jgi:hypothetical protein
VAVARLVNGDLRARSVEDCHEAIRRLSRQGHGHGAISMRLGMNATTVRGIIESFGPGENQGVA